MILRNSSQARSDDNHSPPEMRLNIPLLFLVELTQVDNVMYDSDPSLLSAREGTLHIHYGV